MISMNGPGDSCRRGSLLVRGTVQGVGFRPFVFRLATEHHLAGWVQNNPQGVHIEVEGNAEHLDCFLEHFKRDLRRTKLIPFYSIESTPLDAAGDTAFTIRESTQDGVRAA